MATSKDARKGIEISSQRKAASLAHDLRKFIQTDHVFFFCIGTDRSTGDSLGPMVGSMLEKAGYTNVMGTIHDPIHALNLAEKIKLIPKGVTVIAIDASHGNSEDVGKMTFAKGAILPGTGVGKTLPAVGDYCIKGTVVGYSPYPQVSLGNVRLSVVLTLAEALVSSIQQAFPFEAKTRRSLRTTKRLDPQSGGYVTV